MIVKLVNLTELQRDVTLGAWVDAPDADTADLIRMITGQSADGMTDRALLDTVARH
jgi:hypothetical protein